MSCKGHRINMKNRFVEKERNFSEQKPKDELIDNEEERRKKILKRRKKMYHKKHIYKSDMTQGPRNPQLF